MDENKFEGAARNLGGKIEGTVGNLTGDMKMQAEGAYDKAAGSAQNTYGKAAEAVKDGVDVALRLGGLPDSTATARLIGRTQRVIVASPARALARGLSWYMSI